MSKIQPGHDVLSLFGLTQKHQALSQAAQKSLAPTLISAFLIVVLTVLALAWSTGHLTLVRLNTSSITEKEAVAFQPSQAVSQEISQGYLSSAR